MAAQTVRLYVWLVFMQILLVALVSVESSYRFRIKPKHKYFHDKPVKTYGNGSTWFSNCTGSNHLTIKLAVFVDHALYHRFHQQNANETEAKMKLQQFVFVLLQQVQELFDSPTLRIKVKLALTEYSILPKTFRKFSTLIDQDMQSYMDLFCLYQKRMNHQKRWNHAILLTGLDLVYGGLNQFAGYSTSKSLCGSMSCSLVEATTFKSAYTLAHEFGHSLGMMHDNGSDICPSDCCVMSSVIISGAQNWSVCSNEEMYNFISAIPCRYFCFNDPVNETINFSTEELPGQIVSADAQCQQLFGVCSKTHLMDGQLSNICSGLWCTQIDGSIRLAHSPLEGTYCGSGKWCRSNQCVNTNRSLRPRHGEWSDWLSEDAYGICASTNCSSVVIANQLSVRREFRGCSNPTPDNGGRGCVGDAYRGIVCNISNQDHDQSKKTLVEYAGTVCRQRKLKAEVANNTSFGYLSGEGFQQTGGDSKYACLVWCHTVNTSYTSYTFFDQFPDGTPCGSGRYCVASQCLKAHDCGSSRLLTDGHLPDDCRPVPSDKPVKTGWSEWSPCSKSCDSGMQHRTRICKGECPTAARGLRQYRVCRRSPCAEDTFESTDQVSTTTQELLTATTTTTIPTVTFQSSSSSRSGLKRKSATSNVTFRVKPFDKNYRTSTTSTVSTTEMITNQKSILDEPIKSAAKVHGRWTEWAGWTSCQKVNGGSCLSGMQRGMRRCVPKADACLGPSVKKRVCRLNSC